MRSLSPHGGHGLLLRTIGGPIGMALMAVHMVAYTVAEYITTYRIMNRVHGEAQAVTRMRVRHQEADLAGTAVAVADTVVGTVNQCGG